jgi:hypothetical protein
MQGAQKCQCHVNDCWKQFCWVVFVVEQQSHHPMKMTYIAATPCQRQNTREYKRSMLRHHQLALSEYVSCIFLVVVFAAVAMHFMHFLSSTASIPCMTFSSNSPQVHQKINVQLLFPPMLVSFVSLFALDYF